MGVFIREGVAITDRDLADTREPDRREILHHSGGFPQSDEVKLQHVKGGLASIIERLSIGRLDELIARSVGELALQGFEGREDNCEVVVHDRDQRLEIAGGDPAGDRGTTSQPVDEIGSIVVVAQEVRTHDLNGGIAPILGFSILLGNHGIGLRNLNDLEKRAHLIPRVMPERRVLRNFGIVKRESRCALRVNRRMKMRDIMKLLSEQFDPYYVMASHDFERLVALLRNHPQGVEGRYRARAYMLLRDCVPPEMDDTAMSANTDQTYVLAMKEAHGESWSGNPQGWEDWIGSTADLHESEIVTPEVKLVSLSAKQKTVVINGEKAGIALKVSSDVSIGLSSNRETRKLVAWSVEFRWDSKKLHVDRVEKVSNLVPQIEREIRRYEARKQAPPQD